MRLKSGAPRWSAAILTAIVNIFLVDHAHAQIPNPIARCQVEVVNGVSSDLKNRSIAVRVGSFDSRWSTPVMTNLAQRLVLAPFRPKEQTPFTLRDDRLADLEAAFHRDLNDMLVKSGYLAKEGVAADPDLVLHAELTGVNPGNRAARVFGMGLASGSVRAVLSDSRGRSLSAVTCRGSNGGGWFGWGGVFSLDESGESLLRESSRKIAQTLVQEIGQIPKLGQELAARRRNNVEVPQHNCETDVWREKPTNRWSLQDATKVLGMFMVRTLRGGCPPIITRGVDALWLTSHVQRALRRAEELFAQDENSTLHPFLLAFDADIMEAIKNGDAYAIAVWPFDGAPYYWNREDIVEATFLSRGGADPYERVKPIALIGPPWPPAVFLFPRTTSAGRPLVASLSDRLELHTTLNGRQIVARFDLRRFELRDLSELTASGGLTD